MFHADGRTDMKPITAFRNFANVPKNYLKIIKIRRDGQQTEGYVASGAGGCGGHSARMEETWLPPAPPSVTLRTVGLRPYVTILPSLHTRTATRFLSQTVPRLNSNIPCDNYFPVNPLTPNDHYSGRTAPLTSKGCILYIY